MRIGLSELCWELLYAMVDVFKWFMHLLGSVDGKLVVDIEVLWFFYGIENDPCGWHSWYNTITCMFWDSFVSCGETLIVMVACYKF